jgi:hypothetical protein
MMSWCVSTYHISVMQIFKLLVHQSVELIFEFLESVKVDVFTYSLFHLK